MLFKQFLVAALFTLGSVTALEANQDDAAIVARGIDDIKVEPRDVDDIAIEARDVDDIEIEPRDLDGDEEGHLVARGEQSHRRRCRYGYRRYGPRCCSWRGRHGRRRHCYYRW
ncbi:hypothetical protein HIM_10046 [Hirsutella minnesotensis 3608]|uniref:Uncharacterized protein n=1 Tax=Hirsutella minnesotensis 3608 TaxID=1043627 RepID=A0A0F7ZS16_9HYPO|nr:hypothetical protein HIM_10046 [Hirsutella minnesotensis 3608]